ncbi:MAG: hypothetical protein AAGF11_41075 [Myxococcota bacterium]
MDNVRPNWTYVVALVGTLGTACAEDPGVEDADDAGDTGDNGDPGGDPNRPTPHAPMPPDREEPNLSGEEAARLVTTGIEAFSDMNAAGVIQLVEELATEFSDQCPPPLEEEPEFEADSFVRWIVPEPCTTPSGLTISGDGSVRRSADESPEETLSSVILIGESTRFEHSDGRWIELNGSISINTVTGSEEVNAIELEGTFVGDPTSRQATPLLRPDVQASGEMSTRNGESLSLTGGITSPALAPAISIDFNAVGIQPALCQSEPSGVVSMRDANGYWHELRFTDPPALGEHEIDDPFAEGDCDGCGQLSVDGQMSGSVCLASGALEGLLSD